jgi:Mrp family chromosome partitioning ATPase
MTVSAKVDGIVVVTRLNQLTRPQAAELHRLLATSPARVLGFVLTGADTDEHRYGGYGVEGYRTEAAQEAARKQPVEKPARRRQSRKRRPGGRPSRTGGS